MAVASAQKIFVDAEEEMNFVVHKILASEKPRTILVVPENALITSSLISIKVLAKQILQSKKLVVIVSEDAFGRKLADRAGIVNVRKVSDVTPELWEKAQLAKERDSALLKRHEKSLLAGRQENVGEAEVPEEKIEVTLSEVADTEVEQVEQVEKPEPIEDNPVPITPVKKRLSPKLMKVDGLEILAGGDIEDLEAEPEPVELIEELDIENTRVVDQVAERPDFIGKDWTKVTNTKTRKPLFAGLGKLLKKRGIIIVLILLLPVLLVLGFSLFNATADISLKLKTAKVPVTEEIIARTDVASIDESKLTIPALEITTSEISRSESATATGTAKTGNKATGVIDFYNKTSAVINIATGTKISSISNNLVYIVKDTKSIPAATGATPGLERDIRVEAELFGENYNVTGSSVNTQFKVGNFPTDELVAVRIRDFAGGDSRDVVVVSQQDVDKLKQSLANQVKEAVFAELGNNVPDGYTLLAGSQVYDEESATPVPAVSEQATKFDLNISAKATALVVADKDLTAIAQALITRNQNSDVEIEIGELDASQITQVARQGTKATFKLASGGEVQTKVNVEQIQNDLRGVTVEAAKTYLDNLDQVESYQLKYSASYLPDFLQLMPRDLVVIKITIK
jgi:hypothetical protein